MKVRAKVKCFVENCLREAGQEFEYHGPENTNLEPLKGTWAKKKVVVDVTPDEDEGPELDEEFA